MLKDKIIEMLKEWLQAKDATIFTDDIAINQFAKDIEPIVNQEVERRIKERMPSELDVMRRVRNRKDYLRELGYPTQVLVKYGDAIIETIEWLRSRLTKDGANSSQKTEGGEG